MSAPAFEACLEPLLRWRGGEQFLMAGRTAKLRAISRRWKGYWQRAAA